MLAKILFSSALLSIATVSSASAYEITFEDQPAGPSEFDYAGKAQQLKYDFGSGLTATFNGGVILTKETFQSTDNTNVYATASFGDSSLTNPLTVVFSKSITNFQIDILNAYDGRYELYDNLGDKRYFTLVSEGSSKVTEGFAAAGTMVSIAYLDGCQDFAIDNVTFDQPLSMSTVPLPASAPMFGASLLALGAFGYSARRRMAAVPAKTGRGQR